MTTIPLSTHSLRSKQIYGGDSMEGTEASGRSFARSRSTLTPLIYVLATQNRQLHRLVSDRRKQGLFPLIS